MDSSIYYTLNAAKAQGGTCGFPVVGDRYEGLKAGGQDLSKGGDRQGDPGVRGEASLVIHQQDAGNGSGVGGPMANIQGLYKRDGVRWQGRVARAVVALDSRRTADEDHAKRYFSSIVGAAATRI